MESTTNRQALADIPDDANVTLTIRQLGLYGVTCMVIGAIIAAVGIAIGFH